MYGLRRGVSLVFHFGLTQQIVCNEHHHEPHAHSRSVQSLARFGCILSHVCPVVGRVSHVSLLCRPAESLALRAKVVYLLTHPIISFSMVIYQIGCLLCGQPVDFIMCYKRLWLWCWSFVIFLLIVFSINRLIVWCIRCHRIIQKDCHNFPNWQSRSTSLRKRTAIFIKVSRKETNGNNSSQLELVMGLFFFEGGIFEWNVIKRWPKLLQMNICPVFSWAVRSIRT